MKASFVFLCASLTLLMAPLTHAQTAGTHFQPGEWQISSTVTPSVGHPVHRQVNVCAKSAGQAWQTSSANQKCAAPSLTAITNGFDVKISCSGGAGPVQWKSASNIQETFSHSGSDFHATGTTTTTLSYAGHAPMTTSATLDATGKRTGACQ